MKASNPHESHCLNSNWQKQKLERILVKFEGFSLFLNLPFKVSFLLFLPKAPNLPENPDRFVLKLLLSAY